jgi:hypothetical protein
LGANTVDAENDIRFGQTAANCQSSGALPDAITDNLSAATIHSQQGHTERNREAAVVIDGGPANDIQSVRGLIGISKLVE